MPVQPPKTAAIFTKAQNRSTKADTRSNLLQWAKREIGLHGLTVSLDHISFQALAQAAEVSRSSAQRIWPHRTLFVQDLLMALVEPNDDIPDLFLPQTYLTAINEMLQHLAECGTAEGRFNMWLAGAVAGFEVNVAETSPTPQWQTSQALTALSCSLSTDEFSVEFTKQLAAKENQYLTVVTDLFKETAAVLGIEPTVPFEDLWKAIAAMAYIMVDGATKAKLVDLPAMTAQAQPTTHFGLTRTWNPASYLYCHAVAGMTRASATPPYADPDELAQRLRALSDHLQSAAEAQAQATAAN